jgi:hypothetical protein
MFTDVSEVFTASIIALVTEVASAYEMPLHATTLHGATYQRTTIYLFETLFDVVNI